MLLCCGRNRRGSPCHGCAAALPRLRARGWGPMTGKRAGVPPFDPARAPGAQALSPAMSAGVRPPRGGVARRGILAPIDSRGIQDRGPVRPPFPGTATSAPAFGSVFKHSNKRLEGGPSPGGLRCIRSTSARAHRRPQPSRSTGFPRWLTQRLRRSSPRAPSATVPRPTGPPQEPPDRGERATGRRRADRGRDPDPPG